MNSYKIIYSFTAKVPGTEGLWIPASYFHICDQHSHALKFQLFFYLEVAKKHRNNYEQQQIFLIFFFEGGKGEGEEGAYAIVFTPFY
jgi:hypothetical protein